MTEFAKIHARLDKITEAISFLGISQKEPIGGPKGCDPNPSYLLPIVDENQIETLDNLLRNSERYNAFVEDMSRYAGKSGAMRGQKVALNIIDKWFKREFLVQCSWTGSMKSKTKPNTTNIVSEPDISCDTQDETEEKKLKKINFSSYKRVFEAFYTVIHLADSRYSKQEAEDFLKKQLRNASSRLKQLKTTEVKNVVEDREQQQSTN